MAIKGGNLFFESVSLSADRVKSQRTVTVTAVIGNGALAIDPLTEPDACRNDASPCDPPGIFDTNGYCAEVEFAPTWTAAIAEHACINITLEGAGLHTYQQEFVVPRVTSVTDVSIDVILRGASGQVAEEETRTLTITVEPVEGDGGGGGDGGGPCASDDDCPEGHVCHNGECVRAILGVPRRQALIAGSGIGIGIGLILLSRGQER